MHAEHPSTQIFMAILSVAIAALLIVFGLQSHPVPLVVAVLVWAWAMWRIGCAQACYRTWHAWHRLSDLSVKDADYSSPHGIVLGLGFPWTVRQSAAIRRFLDRYFVLPLATTTTRGSGLVKGTPAFHAVGGTRGQQVVIPWGDLSGHVCIEGATQSGKTYLLAHMLTQLIRHPSPEARGAIVLIDPKGERYLVDAVQDAARQAGREVVVVRPYDHANSHGYNPLSSCVEPFEVRARVDALFPETKEQFFTFGPQAALSRTASMMRALGWPYDLKALHRATVDYDDRRYLLCKYLETLGINWSGIQRSRLPEIATIKEKTDKAGVIDEIASATIRELSQSPERYQMTMSNLEIAMSGITDSSFSHLFAPDSGLTWKEIDERELIVVVQTDSLITADVGKAVSKLITQDYMGYLGHRFFAGDYDVHPLTLVIDEISEVVYPGFTEAINKAGGASGRMILAWQSEADLDSEIGIHMATRLRANVRTRITMQISDDRTAEQISRYSGEQNITMRQSSSMGRRYDGDGSMAMASVVESEESVALIAPEWLTQLPRGEGFARIGGVRYKFLVPHIERKNHAKAND